MLTISGTGEMADNDNMSHFPSHYVLNTLTNYNMLNYQL